MKKIKNELEDQIPKPLKRSNSLAQLGEESSLLKGDRIYELQRKKMDKMKKIENEMMNVR